MRPSQKKPGSSENWRLDRRRLLQLSAATGAMTSLAPQAWAHRAQTGASDGRGGDGADLERRFRAPPPEAALGAYWYWLGGNVTREGITADLEAMREAGILRPMLYSIGKGGPNSPIQPPADALTPHWWGLVEHAVKEADRLGLQLALNFCDGWATASGPWITPELSMQYVVYATQTVLGGRRISGKLAKPVAVADYYRDIAVLAMPYPEAWEKTSFGEKAKITTNLPIKTADPQTIQDAANRVEIVDTAEAGWVQYAFGEPFTLRSVTVRTPSPYGYAPGVYRAANSLEVQASDDGKTFRPVGRLEYPKHGWQTDLTTLTHALPETTAKFFRLVHRKLPDSLPYEEEYDFGQDVRLRFFSIVLSSEPRIHHLPGKNGEQWAISRSTTAADVPDAACVKRSEILDVTDRLRLDGTLDWVAPKGRWRIVRLGYTTNGKTNSAAGGAQGLECDRFNPAAVKLQFDRWFGNALTKIGPKYAGKALQVLHVDSWEAGAQNWSPAFASEFSRLRGYDLRPWLAAMAGIPVDSADASERVLFDVRRTINDLTNENFFKTVSDLAHANGCLFSAEPANPTYFADGLDYARYADFPMGEFWLHTERNDKPNDIKDAVSGGRVYGRRSIGAESFTEGLMDWREHPYALKALGDHNYCEGINRFMLHVYAQQPWTADKNDPGMTLNGIGTFFSRTQTWWKPAQAWFSYLRRCQAMLQAGRSVCDVAYFTGEHVPARALLPRHLSAALPPGYSYDSLNRDALMRLARVENGEIVLECGLRYRVLVLPDVRVMTPQFVKRLRDFANAGATIVGPRPDRSPSFEFGPDADALVRRVAGEVWGDLDGTTRTERAFGRGRVIWGKPLVEVFAADRLPADVCIVGAPAGTVEWVHRRGEGWDAYFLSNQSTSEMVFEATFRVTGRVPRLWHPDTAETEVLARWVQADGGTTVPLRLDPRGSVFAVFVADAVRFDPVVAVDGGDIRLTARGGKVAALAAQCGRWQIRRRSGRVKTLTLTETPPAMTLTAPWRVQFTQAGRDPVALSLSALSSWTALTPETVKYFSGTAHYETQFRLDTVEAGRRLLLDLGTVCEMAEVWLNGHRLGVLWKPPFVADITAAVRAGQNRLAVAVTNTWRNRIVGDTGLPDERRVTRVEPMLRKGQPWLPRTDAELMPSGLIGPVVIRTQIVLPAD